ncbi:MAG: hypothetical protein KatS3mg131_1855 [Candidatus Tectimicrobiota bacterium]|nr:MAG: hypothetical protein KatS3mg131_1855 [Candidatus Tectomicrobia bacterium]
MPIFEFRCDDCGTVFERLLLRAPAESPLRCPCCGSSRVTRVFSTFSSRGTRGTPAPSSAPSAFR